MGRRISLIIAIVISFSLSFSGCRKKTVEEPVVHINLKDFKEPSTVVLKELSRYEKEAIDAYVKRHAWDMTETGTGVQFMIYHKGNGPKVHSEDIILLDFEVMLLDGSVCYSSKETGAEQFRVDYAHVESGLHEASKYLREGDQAVVIIPSHKAFGLLGDMSKIPALSTVVYNLTVVKVYKTP